jgi:hypothetical protein
MWAGVRDGAVRRLVGAAGILCILAASIYCIGMYPIWAVDWTPLERPINLTKGHRVSASFVAARDVRYVLQVDTQRSIPFERQNCLLGIESFIPERCSTIPRELDLSWTVTSGGTEIARGEGSNVSGGYWGPTIGVVLCGFEAKRGHTYAIDLFVRQTSLDLQHTAPKLQIQVSGAVYKGAFVWASFSGLAAGILLVIAIVLGWVAIGRWIWLGTHDKPMEPTGSAGGSGR